jgi:pimeloyl-ACP methyl ester carboxylesterase
MGAAIALLQAAAEPGSAAGLVLTSPALPWVGLARPDPVVVVGFALYRIPRLGEWVARQRAARLGPEGLVRQTLRFCSPHPEAIDPALVAAHVELARQRAAMPEAVPAFLEAVRSLFVLAARRDRVGEVLDRVSCPVLLVHGRRDRLVPVSVAAAVARTHPSWRFRIMEDVGHVAQMEAPDRWLAAVEGWLPTGGLASPGRLARTGPKAG